MIDGHHSDEDPPRGGSGVARVLAADAFCSRGADGRCAPGSSPTPRCRSCWSSSTRRGTGSLRVGSRCWGCGTRGWRGRPMAPSPGPGGWRHAPNRPVARCRARSASRAGCGRCRSRRRRSCPVTSATRRCGSSSTSRRTCPTPTPRRRGSWSSRCRPCASTRSPSCWPAGGPWSTPTAKKNAPHASYEQRSLHVSPLFDGAWRGDANFTTEAGEIIRNAVDRRAREIYRAEKAAADANGDQGQEHRRRNAATTPSSSSSSKPPPPATPATASTSRPSPPSSTSPSSPTPNPPRSSARPNTAPPCPPPPRCGGAATPASPASSPTRLHPPRPRPHRPAPQPGPTPGPRRTRPRLHLPGL